jgi:hypothetical protein
MKRRGFTRVRMWPSKINVLLSALEVAQTFTPRKYEFLKDRYRDVEKKLYRHKTNNSFDDERNRVVFVKNEQLQ